MHAFNYSNVDLDISIIKMRMSIKFIFADNYISKCIFQNIIESIVKI